MDLRGAVALVTGGNGGLGQRICDALAREGAHIAVMYAQSRDQAEGVARELASRYQVNAAAFACDITDDAAVARVVADVTTRFGRLDILVNDAGISGSAVEDLFDTEAWDRLMTVNATGTFLGMKIVAPRMIERGKGSIINISSTAGISGQNGTVAYAASKFGVRGMTKIAALELGHRGVRVNSIHPGGINTVMGVAPGTPPEIIDQYYKAVPLQRIGQPVEVANVSLFLASDESSYVCGAEILADGGMLAGTYYPSLPGAPGS